MSSENYRIMVALVARGDEGSVVDQAVLMAEKFEADDIAYANFIFKRVYRSYNDKPRNMIPSIQEFQLHNLPSLLLFYHLQGAISIS